MRLVDAAEATFARHETFHPRYGWFRKAYAAASDDPFVFGRPDATVVLGVGKNMVRAIRFWGLAAKLIVEDSEPANRRSPGLIPTFLGHALFDKFGWDRYMEDPGTLWLLHWLLLAPPSRLPVWWLAFNEFDAVEFTDRELIDAASAQLKASAWGAPHQSSINKDVTALLRAYGPGGAVEPPEHRRYSGLPPAGSQPHRPLGGDGLLPIHAEHQGDPCLRRWPPTPRWTGLLAAMSAGTRSPSAAWRTSQELWVAPSSWARTSCWQLSSRPSRRVTG